MAQKLLAMSLVTLGALTSAWAQTGQVAAHWYNSSTTEGPRRCFVYCPPGYAADPTARYPVLYLLHGANASEKAWVDAGNIREAMDRLITTKKAPPMLVVMPYGYALRPGEKPEPIRPDSGGPPNFTRMFASFGNDLLSDLIPNIDRGFRTVPDREHRALAGLSMGGLQTMNVGLRHTDTFAYYGGFSGCGGAFGAPIDLKTDYEGALADGPAFNRKVKQLFISVGTKEGDWMLDGVKRYTAALRKQGIKFAYYESPGTTHDWPTWQRSLDQFAPRLFQKLPAAKSQPVPEVAKDDIKVFPNPPEGFDVRREAIPHGKLQPLTWDSKTVGTTRKMLVYTPPGYSPEKKYPVLYLLHGIGANEYQWGWAGKPDIVLDNLIADGRAKPMIVVMPNGCAQKDDEPKGNVYASAPAYAVFERDLLDDLIPSIESRFSVSTKVEDRAIAGLSMGGGQSLNFGFAHPESFGSIGAFSAAPNTDAPDKLFSQFDAAKGYQLLYISCGNKDGLFNISQRTHQWLKRHDVMHVWNVDEYGHDRDTWSHNLYTFLQMVFK